MLYTSYYGNYKNFPQNSFLVQISTSSPYNVSFSLEEVYPSWKELVAPYKGGRISEERYTKKYLRYLNRNKEDILRSIRAFINNSNGRSTILLCYCKKENFCHRHILRQWLNDNGIECKEL